jgi:hypothetical protein
LVLGLASGCAGVVFKQPVGPAKPEQLVERAPDPPPVPDGWRDIPIYVSGLAEAPSLREQVEVVLLRSGFRVVKTADAPLNLALRDTGCRSNSGIQARLSFANTHWSIGAVLTADGRMAGDWSLAKDMAVSQQIDEPAESVTKRLAEQQAALTEWLAKVLVTKVVEGLPDVRRTKPAAKQKA